jgi:PA domain
MIKIIRPSFALFALAALIAVPAAPAFATATIVIDNGDGPNEGFNDPTPAAPVAGNPGTTVGQQRLNAFQFAADIWGSLLESPVTIRIQASFDVLPCTPTAATLGAAAAFQWSANSAGTEVPNTWYPIALANKLAGADLSPTVDDIFAQFNSQLNGNPACLGGRGWYYGFDANHGTNIDLVTVLLHEFGHGLGFANFVNETTGASSLGLRDIYSFYTLDTRTGKYWPQMTNAEIVASSINHNRVVWDGLHVTEGVPGAWAAGMPLVTVNSPVNPNLGTFRIGTAQFGPAITSPGITSNVVQALDPADAAGPTTFDACSPLTNAAAVAGNIAVVDRGTCGFIVKVKNAQDAGAVAVIVANNAAGAPIGGMTGVDPTITIPSVIISLVDGNSLKTALTSGTVNATVGINPNVRQGANPANRALLFAPLPVQQGSSMSHFDTIAFPNALMEPAISADLTHGVDLTLNEMVDIGWFTDRDGVPDGMDSCIGSDENATVVIDGCDSGVANTVFANGCRISDSIEDCADGASNHGGFVSCVSHYTNDLKKNGTITGAQKGAIQSCAGQANIP